MAVFQSSPNGVVVSVRVTPRAGRTAIVGVREEMLLAKLAAAPVDGAANDALIALLSDAFNVPKRKVRLVAGERSRTKRVEIAGETPASLESRLAAILSP